MKITKALIIEKSGRIIMTSGLQALTMEKLAIEFDTNENKFSEYIKEDEDILIILLTDFENEIKEILNYPDEMKQQPERELKLLFNRLYLLFSKKPYYLSIIFDENIQEKKERIKKYILKIKGKASLHLTEIIIRGKKDQTFKTKSSVKNLVNSILYSFRLFMKDEYRINEMILELKTLRTLED
jgi:hypothetical protein